MTGVLTRLFDELVEEGLERETVGDVGEHVKFGTVNEIRIEVAGFDGDAGESDRDGESCRLVGGGFGTRIEGSIENAEGRPGAAWKWAPRRCARR